VVLNKVAQTFGGKVRICFIFCILYYFIFILFLSFLFLFNIGFCGAAPLSPKIGQFLNNCFGKDARVLEGFINYCFIS
jgi:hypothetical protein